VIIIFIIRLLHLIVIAALLSHARFGSAS